MEYRMLFRVFPAMISMIVASAASDLVSAQTPSTLTAEQRRSLTGLTITGAVSDEDFRIMRDEMVGLTEVDLSAAALAELPAKAFSGMSRLTSVTLPASLKKIGDGAFLMNTSLTSISIPQEVTEIGALAFSRSALTDIVIPAGVTKIGDHAFSGCRDLASINVANGNTSYAVVGGTLYNADKTRLIKRPAKNTTSALSIPSTVKYIEPYACDGSSSLVSVAFPEGLLSIGDYSFNNCPALSGSLNLPSTVTHIGRGAFFGATGVDKALYVPEKLTEAGKGAFAYMSQLRTVVLPAGYLTVAPSTFECDAKIATIASLNPVPPAVGDFAMRDVNRQTTFIDVDDTALSSYNEAKVWKEFRNYTEPANGGYAMFDIDGDYYIRYIGDGAAKNKYLFMSSEYGGDGYFMAEKSSAPTWKLEFFTASYSSLKFNGEPASDICYYLDDKVYHINAAGKCYIDPKSGYGNNANRTFGFYMQSPVFDPAEGPVVAIAGNGTLWKATDSGTNLATRDFTDNYPSSADFVFRLIPKTPIVSGIDDITDDMDGEGFDESQVRYFNLQGIEISDPQNGVFIRVTPDGRAKKVRILGSRCK